MPSDDAPPDDVSLRTSSERERLERLAWLLDNSIRLPVVGYRIGLDPIVGLIPGIGDALGAALSGYVVVQGARLGASRAVLLRMAVNALIGVLVGVIPFLGDIFDAVWKANERNVRLLERHLDDPAHTAQRSRWALILLLTALLVVIVAVVILGVLAIDALFGMISSEL